MLVCFYDLLEEAGVRVEKGRIRNIAVVEHPLDASGCRPGHG